MCMLCLHRFLAAYTHLADPKLLEFWLSLPQAQVDKHGILTLSRNTTFLGDLKGEDRLYVRDCYRELYDVIVERTTCGARPARRMVITGTPGIGKSLFALYCLWRLSREGKTLVYQLEDYFYHFSGKAALRIFGQAPQVGTWLADPVSAAFCKCHVIIALSLWAA